MRVAHPTEQKGQMLGTDLAPLMRSSCAWARGCERRPEPDQSADRRPRSRSRGKL